MAEAMTSSGSGYGTGAQFEEAALPGLSFIVAPFFVPSCHSGGQTVLGGLIQTY
jgi:hypothetical protein